MESYDVGIANHDPHEHEHSKSIKDFKVSIFNTMVIFEEDGVEVV